MLVGLFVQSDRPDVLEIGDTELLVSRADSLLEELHTNLEIPMRAALQTPPGPAASAHHFGDVAREFIYYGADSAFAPQYQRFARDRYRPDFEWLLSEKGLSVRPMIEIASWLEKVVSIQVNYLFSREDPTPSDLTDALLVKKDLLHKAFRGRSERFLECFSLPVHNSNTSFVDPFSYNSANSSPLIDLGSSIYIANSYRLYELIYDLPYYWMLADPRYKDAASAHRGEFLENIVAKMMRRCFGEDSVFTNAIIRRDKAHIAAEADVLVVYGEFLLVIQAKSKRLTLSARSGDKEKIEQDFQSAIQAAYDQAVTFIDLLVGGRECELAPSDRRTFAGVTRVFPVVVLSDHFPSLTTLVNRLIRTKAQRSPVVIDIFFMEVLFVLLRSPSDVLYYLQQRARFFHKILTDSEFNLLGFHLKHKLHVGDECDMLAVDQGFATDINEYFEVGSVGADSTKFLPLEERVNVPAATALIRTLKAGAPEMVGVALELLDFSEEALEAIADNIAAVQAEVRGGKPFKAFSIETSHGGLSYVAVRVFDEGAVRVADMIARKHKHKQKKDRWYVLVDSVYSPALVDGVTVLLEEWEDTDSMRRFQEDVEPLLKETYISFKPQTPAEQDAPSKAPSS